MKKLKMNRKTRRAYMGALATMTVMRELCGAEFMSGIVKVVMRMSREDQLTFWNLVNISMNLNEKTHVWYGRNCFHPAMLTLVKEVQRMILEQMREKREQLIIF